MKITSARTVHRVDTRQFGPAKIRHRLLQAHNKTKGVVFSMVSNYILMYFCLCFPKFYVLPVEDDSFITVDRATFQKYLVII